MRRFLLPMILLVSWVAQAQENIYVHTDAGQYRPGERIWMKAYVLDTDRIPMDSSLYVYTELADSTGMILRRVKIIHENGIYAGQMDVPDYLGPGRYYLRAYTAGLMAHPEAHFVKPLVIGRSGSFAKRQGTSGQSPSPDSTIRILPRWSKDADSIRISLDTWGFHDGEIADVSVSVTSVGRGGGAGIFDYFSKRKAPGPWEENFESTQRIRGRVLQSIGKKGIAEIPVALISPQAGTLHQTITDDNGYFVFEGMDYPAGVDFVLQCRDKRGKNRYRLLVEEQEFPAFPDPASAAGWADVDAGPGEDAWEDWGGETVLLDEATVTGIAAQEPPRYAFNASADFSFGPKQIAEMDATCLHEILRRVPGVFIQDEICYIRGVQSIFAETPAAIAIDGLILDGVFDLDVIDMHDVERVDVFRTGQTVIWGSRGGAGVISITTKTGNFEPESFDLANVKKVHPLGYQAPADFRDWKGRHPEARTLFWTPLLQSAHFAFRKGDQDCLVIIEGVTSEGRLIHETFQITE